MKPLAQMLMAVFVVGVLSGCVSNPETDAPLRLRVLTYNIHHGRGADGVIDLQRLADIIKRAGPDLVALQEVDVNTKRSEGVDQPAILGRLTGMSHFFGEAMPFQDGSYGEAILSDLPFDFWVNTPLKAGPGQEPRAAAVIRLTKPANQDRAIVFWGTHLCHESEETRINQVEQLIGRPGAVYFPNILAGDFNFTPDSEAYRILIDAGWVDAAAAFGDPKPTCPADNPTMRIDYVFVRPADAWRVINVQVLDEPVASDHAPLLVELEYVAPK